MPFRCANVPAIEAQDCRDTVDCCTSGEVCPALEEGCFMCELTRKCEQDPQLPEEVDRGHTLQQWLAEAEVFCAPAPDGENCHAAVASTLFTEVRIVLDTSESPEVKAPLCKKWESFQCCFATQHLLYTQCDPMPGNDTDQFMGVVSNCSAHWENATAVCPSVVDVNHVTCEWESAIPTFGPVPPVPPPSPPPNPSPPPPPPTVYTNSNRLPRAFSATALAMLFGVPGVHEVLRVLLEG